MWMKNEKISLRQYKRLLFFDMVGLGLVLLPDLIAQNAANAGGMVIFLGALLATVYKGNIIKNLIMDCQSYTKYRPNETMGGIFVSWRRKEELPTGA